MPIPAEVVNWFRGIFGDVNRRISEKIENVPAIHESHLDTTFIEHLLGFASPRVFPSGWSIRIDTHYIGGLRHWRTWEIADIGVFVFFQQRGRIIRQKVALLQSKRLYPLAGDIEQLEKFDYMVGMARIAHKDPTQASMLATRTLEFTDECRYKALIKGDRQYSAIREHFERYGLPIFYLLYNPPMAPIAITLPIKRNVKLQKAPILGARVVPTTKMFKFLDSHAERYSPSLRDTKFLIGPRVTAQKRFGWRLEHFMADMLLSCREGKRFTDADSEVMYDLFNRRSGPIAAAIAVVAELPEDEKLPD